MPAVQRPDLERLPSSTMTRWEYLTVTVRTAEFHQLQNQLDDLGPRGWELVQIVTVPTQMAEPATFRAVLKRPVYENVPGGTT